MAALHLVFCVVPLFEMPCARLGAAAGPSVPARLMIQGLVREGIARLVVNFPWRSRPLTGQQLGICGRMGPGAWHTRLAWEGSLDPPLVFLTDPSPPIPLRLI